MDFEKYDELDLVQTTSLGSKKYLHMEEEVRGPDEEGKYWAAVLYYHPDEGLQTDFDVDFYEVKSEEVVTTRWVRA